MLFSRSGGLLAGSWIVLSVLASAHPCGGQTTWTGSVSANWGVSGNWSAGVPTASVNAVIPSGTPNQPSTSGVAAATCRDLTLNAGATLTLAPAFPFDVNRDATISGTVAGGGLLRFIGASSSTVSGAGAIGANVDIAKSGAQVLASSSWTVNGDLTLTSGTFQVASSSSHVVSVSGDATFSGGTLGVSAVGTIDVAGDVTFSGTVVTSSAPTIRCGGNWTSNAAYAPTTGVVILDGTGVQTISAAASLPTLTINSGSSTSSSGPLTVGGSFIVHGSFSIPTSTLDVNGIFTVSATGSADLGNGTHTFGANFTGTGPVVATGLLVFDAGNGAAVSSSSPFPSVRISPAPGASVLASDSWTVNGDLTQTSGTFQVALVDTAVVSVSGNAMFSGGILGVSAVGTIDVVGDVTFSGTTVTGSAPTIRCGGDWTSNASFAPTAGSVTLDGTGAQTLSAAATLPTLTISSGSMTTSPGPLTVAGFMTVNGAFSIATSTLDVNGIFTVSATGSADLGGGTHTFGANFTGTGPVVATGLLVFDAGNGAAVSSTSPFPSVQISSAPGAAVGASSSWTVNGNLTQTSGTFQVALVGTDVVSVSGNATFSGGILVVSAVGTLDVAGDVTFSGTMVTGSAPTIRCAGDWTSDAAFAPTIGIVELDGSAPSEVASPTGTFFVPTLRIKNGVRSLAADLTISATTITIDPNASLVLDGGEDLVVHRTGGATTFNVNGALSLASNAELALGPQTTATVSTTGSLSLLGAAGAPARIVGAAGGGYGLTVSGAISAKNFLVKEMSAAGMLINASSAFAAPPNDLRGGTFDFRTGAPSGSVLLDVRRSAPTTIRYAAFLNTPGAAGVFNVKTLASSAAIGFTNWTGAFAGPAFENDPSNKIAWNPPQQTTLTFTVMPGADLAQATWTGVSLVDFSAFSLRRSTSPSGPFTEIFNTTSVASSYAWVDQPLAPNQTYHYELHQQLTHGPSILLATGMATPYSSAPPSNVYKVGGGGAFATIQAAVNAAAHPDSIVWVTTGTHAPFTVGASAPVSLRIIGDGSGLVSIDTSSGPVQMSNVPATSSIELGDMTIGNAATPQSAIVISNCLGAVVLDELAVASAATHAAVSVSGSPGVAIQRCDVSGGPGVLASASSVVAISRGSLSSLVSTGSTIETAGIVPGIVNVTPPASLIAHAGVMPNFDIPEYCRLSYPATLAFDGFPASFFIIVLGSKMGFLSAPPAIEMPVLIDLAGLTLLDPLPTDAAGHFEVAFGFPPVAALLGASFILQGAMVNPATGAFRVSNVATMVLMP